MVAALRRRGATITVLGIALGPPGNLIDVQPVCGCDACDDWSDHLLASIDTTVTEIVAGPFVMLRGGAGGCLVRRWLRKGASWQADWGPLTGSSSSDKGGLDHEHAMELCRRLAAGEDVRLPRGTQAYVSASWLT
jgi:hypothetical protein